MEQIKKIIEIVEDSTKIYLNKSFEEEVDRHKFEGDDVTNLDIKTQEFLNEKLSKLIENSNFIGEEGTSLKNSEYTWVVDPIDGTCNFIHDIFCFGTQVCLLKNQKPILSVLAIPKLNEIYYTSGNNAFLNGKKIFISDEKEVNEMIVNLGDFQSNNLNVEP